MLEPMSAAHQPTASQRQYVELCVAAGIPQQAIAGLIGVSIPTLKAHYETELSFGKQKMLAQVAATQFQLAVGRAAKFDEKGNKTQAEIKPVPACGMFILKCQGGWKETHVFEHVDPTAGATDRLNAAIDRVLTAFVGSGGAEAFVAQNPDQRKPH